MEKVTELQMTVEEIVRSYREAKDKAVQVGILADLNLCSKETIRRVLVEGGLDPRQLPRAPRKKPPSYTQGENLKEQKKKEDAERRAAEAAIISDVTKESLFFYKETLMREAAALKVEYDEKVAALNDKIYAAERALELL